MGDKHFAIDFFSFSWGRGYHA